MKHVALTSFAAAENANCVPVRARLTPAFGPDHRGAAIRFSIVSPGPIGHADLLDQLVGAQQE
jgi:hypothetical protein